MENFTRTGFWSLPDQPDRKITGVLTFSPSAGLLLELYGTLAQTPLHQIVGKLDRVYSLVHGLTLDGKYITLTNCYQKAVQLRSPGGVSETLLATTCYTGAHFDSLEELCFPKLEVRFDYLPDWVNLSGFEFTTLPSETESSPKGFSVTYQFPEEISAPLPSETVTVTFGVHQHLNTQSVDIQQSVMLRVVPSKPARLGELTRRYVLPLQNFLTLAIGRPSSVRSLTVYTDAVTATLSADRAHQLPIEVSHQLHYAGGEPSTQRLFPHDMLFSLADIQPKFTEAMGNWLCIATELREVCNIFFGVLYTPGLYSEFQFLNLAQALEVYHRRRGKNIVLPKLEHRARIRQIAAAVPGGFKEWVKAKLAYSNEPSLRERLIELTDMVGPALGGLLSDPQQFVKLAADTRNYYTHYNPHLRGKAATGVDLVDLNTRIEYLLKVCLLRELGFTLEQCRELLTRNRQFSFIERNW